MRHILRDKNWIFDNYDRMLTNIKGYHKLQSHNIYKYWCDYYNLEKLIKQKKVETFLSKKIQY